METSISLRDDLFQAAERLAASSGLTRSELYAKALSEYVRLHDGTQVTDKLNEVYADVDSSVDDVLGTLQFRSIPRERGSTSRFGSQLLRVSRLGQFPRDDASRTP